MKYARQRQRSRQMRLGKHYGVTNMGIRHELIAFIGPVLSIMFCFFMCKGEAGT